MNEIDTWSSSMIDSLEYQIELLEKEIERLNKIIEEKENAL
jgi:uncharacterized small protein (DUF1192 family)